MRCGSLKISGWRRISDPTAPPTGNACSNAAATKGRSPRKNSPESSRRWLPASAPEPRGSLRHTGFDASHRPGMTLWLSTAAERAARGGSTMDDKGRESGHLMLITPERVFYAGLLGRPRQRCSGAFHVYVAIRGGLRLAAEGAVESYGELAVVPPNLGHTIASDYRSVICVLIEPETVCAGALDLFAKHLSEAERQFF